MKQSTLNRSWLTETNLSPGHCQSFNWLNKYLMKMLSKAGELLGFIKARARNNVLLYLFHAFLSPHRCGEHFSLSSDAIDHLEKKMFYCIVIEISAGEGCWIRAREKEILPAI